MLRLEPSVVAQRRVLWDISLDEMLGEYCTNNIVNDNNLDIFKPHSCAQVAYAEVMKTYSINVH